MCWKLQAKSNVSSVKARVNVLIMHEYKHFELTSVIVMYGQLFMSLSNLRPVDGGICTWKCCQSMRVFRPRPASDSSHWMPLSEQRPPVREIPDPASLHSSPLHTNYPSVQRFSCSKANCALPN